MKNEKLLLFAGMAVCVGVVGAVVPSCSPDSRKKMDQRVQEVAEDARGLTDPLLHTKRELSAAPAVTPHPKVAPKPPEPPPPPARPPIRIFTGTASAPEPEAMGDYAPYGRLVKCELVNTVDSSALTTPIIGLVSEDVVWNGKTVIAKRSEVHGTAQVDQLRERIASEGTFTFVLNDPDSPSYGRELVVSGLVLDREEQADLRTFGITDGSAGLRGVIIKTDKLADVKLFIATFLSGIGEGLKATTTDIFGNVRNNPNGNTAGVPGYLINPAVQGSQGVLDLYAQQIMETIQRDGFFVRVQAGKQFYVYVRQVIDANKAVVGGDPVRARVRREFLNGRAEEESVTQPRLRRERAEAPPAGFGPDRLETPSSVSPLKEEPPRPTQTPNPPMQLNAANNSSPTRP